MDEEERDLLIAKREKLNLKKYFKKFETISLINFEETDSVWYREFYTKIK